jgi:hypothetical protein
VATKLSANTVSPIFSATIVPNPPINDQKVPLALGIVTENEAQTITQYITNGRITETEEHTNREENEENIIITNNTNNHNTNTQTGQKKYLISQFSKESIKINQQQKFQRTRS